MQLEVVGNQHKLFIVLGAHWYFCPSIFTHSGLDPLHLAKFSPQVSPPPESLP